MARCTGILPEQVDNEAERGFTLVEVIVASAIIAILSAIMVPMFYKVWESNEVAETRARMAELKRAMVGDQKMVQNGIRTHYGFAGDNGTLPDAVSDLVSNSGTFANWNGPYMVGAFDPDDFDKDVWGYGLVYTRYSPPLETADGRKIVAVLASVGPDGISGTADDLNENTDPDLQILLSEVWPTDTVQGNLNFVFSATADDPGKTYYANVLANFADPAGSAVTSSGCTPAIVTGEVFAGSPRSVSQAFSVNFPGPLPVGRVHLRSRLFSDTCTTLLGEGSEFSTFVSDGLSVVSVNMPTMYQSLN
jgi:prepilin-type N-terminal cleavage/methylation domain-containing protein